MSMLLLVVCAIAIGTQVKIPSGAVSNSELLKPSLLGWQLVYILPVAIVFNDFFLASFWQRTFASKDDRQLLISCILTAIFMFIFLTLVAMTGVIASWAGVLAGDTSDGQNAFFDLLALLPNWVVGFVLVFAIALSCGGKFHSFSFFFFFPLFPFSFFLF